MKRIDLQISDAEHEWLKNKVVTEERTQTDIIREMFRNAILEESFSDRVVKVIQQERRAGGLLS